MTCRASSTPTRHRPRLPRVSRVARYSRGCRDKALISRANHIHRTGDLLMLCNATPRNRDWDAHGQGPRPRMLIRLLRVLSWSQIRHSSFINRRWRRRSHQAGVRRPGFNLMRYIQCTSRCCRTFSTRRFRDRRWLAMVGWRFGMFGIVPLGPQRMSKRIILSPAGSSACASANTAHHGVADIATATPRMGLSILSLSAFCPSPLSCHRRTTRLDII